MNISLKLLSAISIFAVFFVLSCTKQEPMANNTKLIMDIKNFDTTVSPSEDFYQYANGGWLKNNPIPDEDSRYGAFEELRDENIASLKSMFEEASKSKNLKKGTLEQKIGDFFASGMDTAKIDQLGVKPLAEMLARIDKLASKEDIQNMIAEMHSYGTYSCFILYPSPDEKNSELVIANFYQGGLGLPDRDYYLKNDDRNNKIREQYAMHLAKMLGFIGYSSEASQKATENIISLEKRMAQISRSRLDLRDPQKNYNKMDLEGLQKLAPNMNWANYFSAFGISNLNDINVGQPEFLKEISKAINDTPIEVWKDYFKWNLINQSADFLSSDIVNQNFEFYGKTLTGRKALKPRWKRISDLTSSALGELVGQLFVKKYFPPEAKSKMLELVSNLRKSLKQRINQLTWMSEATKQEALAKLDKINVKIGYPDKWIDYSTLDITRESFFQNIMNATKFEMKRQYAKIGKAVDRTEWHMTPQTVNAYYSPNLNEIVFPAAILQPPFFNPNADDAVNYGAIGVVIGHEMTHGFDDQGRQYDKNGNLHDWWTKDDADKFTNQVKPLIEQYDSFVAIDTMRVNGALTLGENIADVGGLITALNALKMSMKGKAEPKATEGFTWQQRFFLSYALIWRNNIREEELMNRLITDVHSPGKFRTNGALANINEFYDAFNIKPGGKYYLPPEKRARVW